MELSKSELRATRNSLITDIMSNSDCGLQEISRIFNLSEGYLKNYILKDIKPFQVKVEHSLEQLKEYRANIMTDLKQQRFTEKEILYIFNCKSSNEDLRSLYLRTFEEHEILADKYETLSLAYKSLEDKNKNLELDNNRLLLKNKQLSESVKASIKLQQSLEEIRIENSSLKEKLLESQQANKKSQEENSHLNQEIENLQRFKESASKYYIEQSEKESEQQLRIHILESDLQEAYKVNNHLKQTNQNLINENSELQSLSSSIIYLQADLTTKDNLIKDLESEIQSLKTEIENLTAPSEVETEKIDSKFERVYTDLQIQQMIDIYFKNHCKRKQSLEAVRAALNINISDKHFVRLLQEADVFKATYRKRKSKNK